MPDWDPDELWQAAAIATAIESYPTPRRHAPPAGDLWLRLSEAEALKTGLASTPRALVVRQLCRALGFDEDHHFRWRMEHKLVQAHILNHFVPKLVPVTVGLDRLAQKHSRERLSQALKDEFPDGVYIKPALGDSSGEEAQKDKTSYYLEAIENGSQPYSDPAALTEERIVVQERLWIRKEYRVHTLEDRVVEDLTFLRYGRGNIPGERDAPNAWMQAVLDCLPPALLGHSILGWDISVDALGRMRVIEANFTGYHPQHRQGFQCSGFFQDPEWGASMTARLLHFVEKTDGVLIHLDLDAEEECKERDFYQNVARWQGLLRSGKDR